MNEMLRALLPYLRSSTVRGAVGLAVLPWLGRWVAVEERDLQVVFDLAAGAVEMGLLAYTIRGRKKAQGPLV